MEKKTQLNLWFAAAAFAALLLVQFVTATTTYEPIPYSQFQTYLKDGKFRGTTDSNFIGTLLSWIVPTLVFFEI